MYNEQVKELANDLLKAMDNNDFLNMAYLYDEILLRTGGKFASDTFIFAKIADGNTFPITKQIKNIIQFDDEPVMVHFTHNHLLWFSKMYVGATVESEKKQVVYGKIYEMTDLREKETYALSADMMKKLHLKVGDFIKITVGEECFCINKFTREEVEKYII